jgi:hypothetical protein
LLETCREDSDKHITEENVRQVGYQNCPYGVLVEKPKGDLLEYVGVDGRIILKWFLKE